MIQGLLVIFIVLFYARNFKTVMERGYSCSLSEWDVYNPCSEPCTLVSPPSAHLQPEPTAKASHVRTARWPLPLQRDSTQHQPRPGAPGTRRSACRGVVALSRRGAVALDPEDLGFLSLFLFVLF